MSSGKKKTESTWNSTLNTVRQATPTEQALQNESLAPINWLNSSGRDIRDLKQMQPYLQTFDMANQKAQQERMGTGALRMGESGSAQYANNLRTLVADQRARDFAGGLENAWSKLYGNAMGQATNVSQLANQRNLGALGSATNLYSTEINKPSIWGSVLAGAAQVGSAALKSDIRLKSNIKPSKYGLEQVLKLNPVWYIMDGQEQVGFIAQDVERIMPELVVELRDGLKGVMYANMVSVLAKAVQELHEELASVKKKRKRKMLSSLRSWLKSIL